MKHKEMHHIHFKVRSIDNDTLPISSMTKTGIAFLCFLFSNIDCHCY